MGPTLARRAPPMADCRHGPTMLDGCLARFCADPPAPGPLAGLTSFVKQYCETHYPPIPLTADLSQSTWLKNAPYPQYRKDELLTTWHENHECIQDHDTDVDGHGKNECYPKYKHARGINSRKDMFKCATGPYFHAMEETVYQDPCFIKHIPVRKRPQYIVDMLGGFPGPFYETDYKQFEKHFTPKIMKAIEMILYKHMLHNFPEMYDLIEKTMTGTNKCTYKHFRIKIQGRRMSGEMCTSLGNGFSNLMLAKYIAYSKGGELHGVVEGDDGLFYSSVPITADDFKKLGFEIKMETHNDLLRTSFCGLIMSSDLCTMTDPRKVLLNIGWTHSLQMHGGPKVLHGLLRAKALSLAYEHPRCPILSSLAISLLARTSGYKAIFGKDYHGARMRHEMTLFQEETMDLLSLGPSLQCRHDFAEHFRIPVSEQLAIEQYLLRGQFTTLDHPAIEFLFDSDWDDTLHYYQHYTSHLKHGAFVN